MGKKIVRMFEEADAVGGLVAKMRLASLVQVTSTEAETIEDRPELVTRVQQSLEEIRKQFSGLRDDKPPQSMVVARAGDDQSQLLRRHLKTYLDMMSQRSLFLGDTTATVRRVTEAGSSTLDVRRMSVWFCDPEQTRLTCADLFERDSGRHSSGTELLAKDFSPYFRALRGERTIAANDAHSDPRTSCFSKIYLEPLGINSLLDVPIWLGKKMVGVVCHEHVGPRRIWTKDEETFAYLMSNFVALALERRSSDGVKSTRDEAPMSSLRVGFTSNG
jgi:GAF domain-containing protein